MIFTPGINVEWLACTTFIIICNIPTLHVNGSVWKGLWHAYRCLFITPSSWESLRDQTTEHWLLAMDTAQQEPQPGAGISAVSDGIQTKMCLGSSQESFLINQLFQLGSFSSKLGNYCLCTMKKRLQARQNNSSCYWCQDVIAYLCHTERVTVSILLTVNNGSSLKQYLSFLWLLSIKNKPNFSPCR